MASISRYFRSRDWERSMTIFQGAFLSFQSRRRRLLGRAILTVLPVTLTGPTALGHLSSYPGGTSPPLVSSINFRPGQTRANNAIALLGIGGTLTVSNGQPAGTTEFIIDVNGYFE